MIRDNRSAINLNQISMCMVNNQD
uniref:Uncharacterized protein n=1 Tax=Arundo donax TaxID=35708 RepID=A0A0A8YT79_ARUDO